VNERSPKNPVRFTSSTPATIVDHRVGRAHGSARPNLVQLFTFLCFPHSLWKALRSTNALERINDEFRRRTKTQASLPGQDAVLLLLFGLLRSGQVKLRALVGSQDMEAAKAA
jgi:transposase-like protein